MAKAAGSILFNTTGLDDTTRITIDDGQGNGHSQLTFVYKKSTPTQSVSHNAQSGSQDNGFVFDGNASKAIMVYEGNTSNNNHLPYLWLFFDQDGQDASFFKDISTGGTTPAILEFRDYDLNIVNVTFVNTASHTDGTAVSGASHSRKTSAGNYELNTNSNLTGANVRDELIDILIAARDASEFSAHASFLRNLSNGLQIPAAGIGRANMPMSVRIKRASGSWSETSVPLFRAVVGSATGVMAKV